MPVCRFGGWSPYGLVTASGQYGRHLEGRNPDTGEVTWSVPLNRYVIDMAMANGQVFVLERNTDVRKRTFHLEAFDIPTGRRLWTRPLGDIEHRRLGTWRHRVFVERRRLLNGRSVTWMRVFDGLRGRAIKDIQLPASHRATTAAFDGRVVAAYFDAKEHKHFVSAWSLQTGERLWAEQLEGRNSTESLVPAPGGKAVLLRSNGDLITMDAATGKTVAQTRIYVGERGPARPFPGTAPFVDDKHFILVPPPARGSRVATYDRATGKLLWDVVLTDRVRPSRIEFGRAGDTLWVLTSIASGRPQTNRVLLVDMRTGKRVQSLEPAGLSGSGLAPEVTSGHGSLILIGRRGATILGK